MLGNGRESFRFSITDGKAHRLRNPFGTVLTRSDGTKSIFRDRAIPSHQFGSKNQTGMNRAALPTQGFMYVFIISLAILKGLIV